MAKKRARRRARAHKGSGYKLNCGRKPRQKITGYGRCQPGTAGSRTTTEERRRKVCRINPQQKKVRVGGHRRKVCHS